MTPALESAVLESSCGPESPGTHSPTCRLTVPRGPQAVHPAIRGPSPTQQQVSTSPGNLCTGTLPSGNAPSTTEGWTSRSLGWGPAPSTSDLQLSAPPQQKDHAAHTRGTPRAYSFGDQRGVCYTTPQNISYIKSLLQDQETKVAYQRHRNKHRELGKVRRQSQSVSQFSRSIVSDSLRPHELQHARPPCPSLTPGVHSDSRPSSQ